jgi:REP element-mobilizing transposase RayT
MGRPWRIEFDGAYYHVMSRGNEGRNIFFDDNDRYGFLGVVGEILQRFEIDVFAYGLMDNHYHLLIRNQRANLSKAMRWLGVTYSEFPAIIPDIIFRQSGSRHLCLCPVEDGDADQ